jgi:hypothetical protein
VSTYSTVGDDDVPSGSSCWCCGREKPQSRLLRLGARPEAAVCTDCAMHLRRRAGAQATRNPVIRHLHTAGNRVRDGVMATGVHKKPVVGPVLRWINRRLPY